MRIPVFVWFLIPTLVLIIAGAIVLSNSSLTKSKDESQPTEVSSSVEGVEEFEIVGRQHIAEGTSGSGYNSDPPTSGSHWPAPVKNGIYEDQIPDERTIHNLEHGYVWITYKNEISPEDKRKLEEIVRKDDWKIIISPREKNENSIILVAWGRLLRLDNLDQQKVEDFIRIYRNRGPERTPE